MNETKGDVAMRNMSNMNDMIMEPERQRPLGVTIIATIVMIGGAIALVGALLGIFGIGFLGHHISGMVGGFVSGIGYILGAIALLIAIVTLFVSWGLWTLRPWAFWVTIVVEALAVLNTVISYLRDRVTFLAMIGQLIIPVIILAYFLFYPKVRRAFRI
jgi:hypothetical protein